MYGYELLFSVLRQPHAMRITFSSFMEVMKTTVLKQVTVLSVNQNPDTK